MSVNTGWRGASSMSPPPGLALRIEEWGGYVHVANVTLEDGTGCNRVDLPGVKGLRSPAMAKSDFGLGTHVVTQATIP